MYVFILCTWMKLESFWAPNDKISDRPSFYFESYGLNSKLILLEFAMKIPITNVFRFTSFVHRRVSSVLLLGTNAK